MWVVEGLVLMKFRQIDEDSILLTSYKLFENHNSRKKILEPKCVTPITFEIK